MSELSKDIADVAFWFTARVSL